MESAKISIDRYDKLLIEGYQNKSQIKKSHEFIEKLMVIFNYISSPKREITEPDHVLREIRVAADLLDLEVKVDEDKSSFKIKIKE